MFSDYSYSKEQLVEMAVEFPVSTKSAPNGKKFTYNYKAYLFNVGGYMRSMDEGYVHWYIIHTLIEEYRAKVIDFDIRCINDYTCVFIKASIPNFEPEERIRTLIYVYKKDFNDWVGCVCNWGEQGEIYYLCQDSLEKNTDNLAILNMVARPQTGKYDLIKDYDFTQYLNKNRTFKKSFTELVNEWTLSKQLEYKSWGLSCASRV